MVSRNTLVMILGAVNVSFWIMLSIVLYALFDNDYFLFVSVGIFSTFLIWYYYEEDYIDLSILSKTGCVE